MRTAQLSIIYDGVDISTDIAPYVSSFAYTDHEGGQADDLRFSLEDRAGRWRSAWYPQKGAIIKAALIAQVGDSQKRLSCGTFAIDELGVSGPPSAVTVKAVSSLTAKAFKREKHTRGWDQMSLQAIAARITSDYGLTLFFSADKVPQYGRIEQRDESDLAFLRRLCREADFNLKLSEEKIIIYESKTIEQRPAVATLALSPALSRYNFSDKTLEIYRACEVQYWDADQKKELTYRYDPPDPPPVGQVLKINQRAENLAAAIDLAKRSLRRKNKLEQTGEIVMPGDPAYLAGLNIQTSGFGVFDAKQFITEAHHSYERGAGYKTTIKFRRILSW